MAKRTYEEETALIAELEASVPELENENNLYAPENQEWHIHMQKIRDAYWRRRQLSAKPGEVAPG